MSEQDNLQRVEDNYMLCGEAAKMLRVSPRTALRLFDRGKLKGYRSTVTGYRMISRTSLLAYLNDSAGEPITLVKT